MFFGQDQVLRTVRGTIKHLPQRLSQLLLILGASGCCKSSLLRAGLLAERHRWIVLEPFRPGKQPFKGLHQVVSERFTIVRATPPGARACTVEQLGDQLEYLRSDFYRQVQLPQRPGPPGRPAAAHGAHGT